MEIVEMHRRAQDAFAGVLARVTEAQLGDRTPCDHWSVGDIVGHVRDGNLMTVQHLGGNEQPLAGGDRVTQNAVAADRAHEALAAPGALDGFVELPFGSIPAAVFAAIRSGDLYAHAWDLATAIGADTDLDPELGVAVHAATAPVMSPALRGDGQPFGREQPCPDGAAPADRFAAFLGRTV